MTTYRKVRRISTGAASHQYVAWCERCRKQLFDARDRAKQAARLWHENRRAYRCPHLDGWHIGRLPGATREGRKTAGEAYGDRNN